jgi:hypothetical protein
MEIFQPGTNPLISGGLILMMIGGILFYLKRLPGRIYDLIERFFIVKIEILDEDESYQWMQVWLAERLRYALSISVVTRRKRPHDPGYDEAGSDEDNGKLTVYFVDRQAKTGRIQQHVEAVGPGVDSRGKTPERDAPPRYRMQGARCQRAASSVADARTWHHRNVLRCRGPTRGPWSIHVYSMGPRNGTLNDPDPSGPHSRGRAISRI